MMESTSLARGCEISFVFITPPKTAEFCAFLFHLFLLLLFLSSFSSSLLLCGDAVIVSSCACSNLAPSPDRSQGSYCQLASTIKCVCSFPFSLSLLYHFSFSIFQFLTYFFFQNSVFLFFPSELFADKCLFFFLFLLFQLLFTCFFSSFFPIFVIGYPFFAVFSYAF